MYTFRYFSNNCSFRIWPMGGGEHSAKNFFRALVCKNALSSRQTRYSGRLRNNYQQKRKILQNLILKTEEIFRAFGVIIPNTGFTTKFGRGCRTPEYPPPSPLRLWVSLSVVLVTVIPHDYFLKVEVFWLAKSFLMTTSEDLGRVWFTVWWCFPFVQMGMKDLGKSIKSCWPNTALLVSNIAKTQFFFFLVEFWQESHDSRMIYFVWYTLI